jgi:hypothetical protein
MKKIVWLIFILLTSCIPAPASPSPVFTSPPPIPVTSSFAYNQDCPHVCWLGINPGTTTTDEAKALLRASDQIDHKWDQISNTGIVTIWYPDRFKTFPSTVGVHFEKDLVKSIYITNLPFTVNDFLKLLGEPDQIRISVQKAEVDYVQYAVYFSLRKVMIDVYPASWIGPNPTDTNFTLTLNVEFNDPSLLAEWGENQPWLGYSHLKDYLPGVQIPTVSTSKPP